MDLIIKELDELYLKDVGKCDGQFVIDSQLVLHAENNQIRYTVIDRPPTVKRYARQEVDYSTYLDDPEKTVFLAYVDRSVAGQIILWKNWNEYAYIDDIVVDINFRRLGIGRALIDQAKSWARRKELPGIMLETQTNNVRACKFYEGCGFKLGGFDNYLYRGMATNTDEVALYWYFHFEDQFGARLSSLV